MADSFTARLKTALVDDPTARFVYLNNFEVERNWGQDEPGLPGAGLSFSAAMVNRMEEVGVLLADEELALEPTHMTIVGHKNDARAKTLHAFARALPGIT